MRMSGQAETDPPQMPVPDTESVLTHLVDLSVQATPKAELPQPRARILNFAPNSSLKSDNRQTPGQPKNPIGRESGQLEEAPSAR